MTNALLKSAGLVSIAATLAAGAPALAAGTVYVTNQGGGVALLGIRKWRRRPYNSPNCW